MASLKEMASYVFYVFVFGFILASACYMIESDAYDTKFTSIPDAFWVYFYVFRIFKIIN
jgi:hypothetical protein